jgi:hypothetical protein
MCCYSAGVRSKALCCPALLPSAASSPAHPTSHSNPESPRRFRRKPWRCWLATPSSASGDPVSHFALAWGLPSRHARHTACALQWGLSLLPRPAIPAILPPPTSTRVPKGLERLCQIQSHACNLHLLPLSVIRKNPTSQFGATLCPGQGATDMQAQYSGARWACRAAGGAAHPGAGDIAGRGVVTLG